MYAFMPGILQEFVYLMKMILKLIPPLPSYDNCSYGKIVINCAS